MALAEKDRQTLLQVAHKSIEHGLKTGKLIELNLKDYPPHLLEERATFVTLKRHGKLRGCIGMIEAVQPLVQDVVHSAYAAAFKDRRFPPLEQNELSGLEIHISVLSPLEEIKFSSEQDLLAKIRPGIDGLIIEEGVLRGTFLPVMWEEIPEPREFVRHLKIKAGLPSDYWSDTIRVWRYTTETIP